MPYKITWKTRGIVWTFYDTLTSKDVVQSNLDIYGDQRFDDLRYGIVDLSNVAQFDVTSEDVDVVAALDGAATLSNPRLFVAVIAATEEAVRVAELYELGMSLSKWKVKIFNSINDAQEWLSLSCDDIGDVATGSEIFHDL